MELIIAILFFSLASAVCVRLFTSAHSLSVDSINLSNSVTWSQNLAEVPSPAKIIFDIKAPGTSLPPLNACPAVDPAFPL